MKRYKIIIYGIITISLMACTDLNEDLRSDISPEDANDYLQENVDFSSLLETVYRDFDSKYIQHTGSVWLFQEVSADHAVVPSRPSGWNNGGVYRQIQTHNVSSQNPYLMDVWGGLNKGVFDATNVLQFDPDPTTEAEARFLRAYFMYTMLDLFNRVPYREPNDNLLEPSQVFTDEEAADFIINEVEEILPNLSDSNPPYLASKNGARGLLARLYLNKAVYRNRENPQFEEADLDKVIQYADAIQGKSLGFYWDNFVPNNNEVSSEILFSIEGEGGVRSHSMWVWWHAIFPTEIELPNGGGWNGFASTPEAYDIFEEEDIRKYYEDPVTEEYGYNAGFLTGQQYDPEGEPLEGVVFTKEIPTLVGASLYAGYRPVKYIPDYEHPGAADNDYILIRYADVLLMKAEALLRKGQSGAALDIVNQIRSARDLGPLSSLDLDSLLDVRGRELYWEGHRRQDLIRFGKFLGSWTLKEPSDPSDLVFPVPQEDVIANPNLSQNPGY